MQMERDDKQHRPDTEQYGYSYGAGYGSYGYGYGSASIAGGMRRGFNDYLLILRERFWYIAIVFLVVFASSIIFTLNSPKIYQSTATILLFRNDSRILKDVEAVNDTRILGVEDINSQVKVLESLQIVGAVAHAMMGEELARFLAPYAGNAQGASAAEILLKNRRILPNRLTLVVNIIYQHPDREIAAKVANRFAEEYLNYTKKLRLDDSYKAFDSLKLPFEEQQKKVIALQKQIADYKEANDAGSLDAKKILLTRR